jgi:GNAT superfamily N-acetyltransferase
MSVTTLLSAPVWSLRRLHVVSPAQVEQLADVLIDCVDGGASVSFMAPLSREHAVKFWRMVAEDVADGERALIVAEDADGVCGTIQLILAQPENQSHRADVAKMLVHRRARRHGIGAALIQEAEHVAHDCGKSLLVLDTVTGSDADRLYERHGWVRVGEVPDYAQLPHGELRGTTFFYRRISAAHHGEHRPGDALP